ncbi:class II fructose-bisphosphatase [Methanimicrococcus blatticola]|uniref:Fructose-1,6-bisphosphatase n=1 Tax=Methanimicrococcus blatticola TaxID=91560 RepID=A0A484F8E0_9EURY|nr:class II fructose-bisphosphatase [Methanimicrococcus blatticola]MBZ3936238.1 class II fructose-bisphosphatase [Methanimicrococcus blatticola]MCC2508242.1 class II fructose-bisphosphatase [Methanimicrococcus blatticola]TDQ70304.1 fructose-1,6-bisphosphatase II [Methanimicrococcus blatticola]
MPHPKTTEEMMAAAGPIEKNLSLSLLQITEAAAVASAYQVGKGDRKYADHVAVEAMRRVLNHIDMKGTVKIGEGERDEAPMLYIGEAVGTGNGPEVEIAVDPLEGTNLAADDVNGSIAVMSMAEKGGIFYGPDIYFDKIVVGPKVVLYEKKTGEKINLDAPVLDNLKIVSKALDKKIEDLTVVVLERDRHNQKIKDIRAAGARVRLIPDGDLLPGVMTCFEESGVDMVMGAGGSGEAVLTASALKCLGGKITGRLVLPSVANEKSEDDILKEFAEKLPRLQKMGIAENEIDMIRETDDLVPGKDVIFAATAVTDGPFMKGTKLLGDGDACMTSILTGSSGAVRITQSVYIKDKENKSFSF